MCISSDPDRLKLLKAEWEKYGGCLQNVNTAQEVIDTLQTKRYHLIAISADYMNGHLQPTVKAVRDATDMPILVMTSDYNSVEMVASLRNGADEYAAFPNTVEESIMIGYALIRRYCDFEGNRIDAKKIGFHGIQLDLQSRKAFIEDRAVQLTRGEFKCLSMLISHPGQTLEYDMLYYGSYGETAQSEYILTSLRSLIRRIRQKVGPEHSKYIKSVRGTGYRVGADE